MSAYTPPPPLPSGDLDAAVDRTGTWSRKVQGRQGAYIGRSPAVDMLPADAKI